MTAPSQPPVKQASFLDLLHDYEVEIPIIQRDYAQGREAQQELREAFVKAFKDSLTEPSAGPLDLDFIYGTVEGGKFCPLDGQQRLTTLFLLHWYLACKEGCHARFSEVVRQGERPRFSYAVRPSSRDFFFRLTIHQPFPLPPREPGNLSAALMDEPWFHRAWKLDPTVDSALRMLDAIHRQFAEAQGGCYERLEDRDRAPVMRRLNLGALGLSDDLYIKMNSRGKPLTPFESFKAQLEGRLDDLFGSELLRRVDVLDRNVTTRAYFSYQVDGAWADLFWNVAKPEVWPMDEKFMHLFHAVAIITRPKNSESAKKAVTQLRDSKTYLSFGGYQDLDCVDRPLLETLICLLDAWSGNENGMRRHIPHRSTGHPTAPAVKMSDCPFFDEGSLFAQITADGASLNYSELVQFYGYAEYLRRWAHSPSTESFADWMRVIYNLAHNTAYDKAEDMLHSLEEIDRLLEHSADILKYLASSPAGIGRFREQQVQEEIRKAQLLCYPGQAWRPLIKEAERHPYFRGQVGFLLDFSTIQNTRLPDPSRFENYYRLANRMFDQNGLTEVGGCRWERALLTFGDYLLEKGSNHSFLDAGDRDVSWRRLLRGEMRKSAQEPAGFVESRRALIKQLWDELAAEEPCLALEQHVDPDLLTSALDRIIAKRVADVEDWRRLFIECPQTVKECRRRMMRRQYGSHYLLWTSQMRGYHAELYTMHLEETWLKLQSACGRLRPLVKQDYQFSNRTDDEPHNLLHWPRGESTVAFAISCADGTFNLSVSPLTANLQPLLEGCGFTPQQNALSMARIFSGASELKEMLPKIAAGLRELEAGP